MKPRAVGLLHRGRVARFVAAPLFLLTALMLSACGGGGDAGTPPPEPPPPPPPPTSLLTPDKAWTGERPAGAQDLEPAAFEAALRSGELRLITRDEQAQAQTQARARRVAAVQADLAYLQGQSERSEKLDALLVRAASATDLYAESVIDLGAGKSVRLLSVAQEVASTAAAHRAARDPQSLRASYQDLYALLTQEQREGLPSAESLAAASLETLHAALSQLDAALETQPFPDGSIAIVEPADATPKVTPIAGSAMDTPSCTSNPTGLVANFSWPLKRYVTPVRDQASRGLCWAFTAIGALESRELVLAGRTVNLSEQFLANKVKAQWDAENFEDGYVAEAALSDMIENRQSLPDESYWTYNPSTMRAKLATSDASSYFGVCNGYNGSCSQTAHQSPLVCTSTFSPPATYCSGYRTITHDGPGVSASFTAEIWDGDDPLPLARIRSLLANGATLMASLGVRVGFRQPQNGFVTDFRDGYFDDENDFVSGSEGGHAVLIIGYIDAADVRAAIRAGTVILPGVDPNIGGQGVPDFINGTFIPGGFPLGVRGYFIIKNSWGCSGDGAGYIYVPDRYVQQYFNRISSLSFDPLRSPVWQQQAFLRRAGNSVAEQGVAVDLFSAAPPPSGTLAALQVQATSSNPADRIDLRTSIFGTAVYGATFGSAGRRIINVRVSYPGVLGELLDSFAIDVRNSAPVLQFINLPTRPITVAETVPLSVFITDPRGTPAPALCRSVDWRLQGADLTLDPNGSCSQRVRFAESGFRQVLVSAQGSSGLTGSTSFVPRVQPAAENPFPRVIDASLSRSSRSTGPQNCSLARTVPQDAEIDLRSNITACDGTINRPPYNASAAVENPSAESLSYAWTFWVGTPDNIVQRGGDSSFGINAQSFGLGGSLACGVGLTVTPPEPSRAKNLPVWQGRCLLAAASPG